MDKYLLCNCRIIDMVEEKVKKKDLLIENGLIKGIYNQGEVNLEKKVDLNYKFVLPGFIDSHVHLMPSCINEFSLNLEKAKSVEEVLEIIKNKRKENPSINMIIGSRLTEFSLKDKRLPTKEDLDIVANDIPVFLSSIEFHTVTVNSFALHKLKLPLSIGKIKKDKFNQPTGEMVNNASIIARKKMYEMVSENKLKKGLNKVYNKIIKNGITSLIAIEGGYLFHNKHVDFLLKNKEDLDIDIDILFSTTDIEKVKAYGFNKIGGDIFFDGSFRSRNAKISESYLDEKNETGKLFFSFEEIKNLIKDSIKENLQISIHAVGNIGIKKLLDAYEDVLKDYPNNNFRHKIEHFELPDFSDIKRAKKLGLILTMHPSYESFFREKGGMYDKRLGKDRALMTNPFRKIFDEDIIVAAGSDSHVLPLNPLVGIHSAVNHPNIKSQISVFEALKMYTINGAYSNFEEDIKGTIEVGKKADLVILSENPLSVEKEKIKNIKVLKTIKDGKIIYSRND